MELTILRNNVLKIFNADKTNLPICIMAEILNNNIAVYDRYLNSVNGDLTQDYLSKIYQYDFADREKMKQDYTPPTLAELSAKLLNENKPLSVFDQCAGTGSLSIAFWNTNKNIIVTAIEKDKTNIPFLLFNYAVRNIQAIVINGDALNEEADETIIYQIAKGEKYGRVIKLIKEEGEKIAI